MSILALILVLDASILASIAAQPDLPDDFVKSPGNTAAVEPKESQPTPLPVVPAAVPSIRFEAVAKSTAKQPRLPRGLLIVGQYCSPCLRIEKECADLIGGPEAPLELVQNWLANDLDELGVSPGMLQGTPTIVILGADGKIHSLSKTGFGCRLIGYQTRETIEKFLTDPTHLVSLDPPDEEPIATATISNAQLSASTIAAALSAHLQRTQPVPQASTGLFDITVDAPDSARGWIADLLSKQSVEFPSAGVSAQWGGDRTISIAPGKLRISPGAIVSVKKFGVQVTTTLTGVTFADDLSWVTLELKGVPDLTVRFE